MLIDKLPDVANIAIGALSFGQAIGDQPFSIARALSGVGLWVVLMGWATVMAHEGEQS